MKTTPEQEKSELEILGAGTSQPSRIPQVKLPQGVGKLTDLQDQQGPLEKFRTAHDLSRVAGKTLREIQGLMADSERRLAGVAIDIYESHLRKQMVSQGAALNQHFNEKLLAQQNRGQIRIQEVAAEGMHQHAASYAAQCSVTDAQLRDGILTEEQWVEQRNRLAGMYHIVKKKADNAIVKTLDDVDESFAKTRGSLNN